MSAKATCNSKFNYLSLLDDIVRIASGKSSTLQKIHNIIFPIEQNRMEI